MLFLVRTICGLTLVVSIMFSTIQAHAGNQPIHIVVNLPSLTLTLFAGDAVIKEYPVAIGKIATPTPVGNYSVFYKEVNPAWIPPGRGYIVPSGPSNPLGYRWMEFLSTYGIHGTNAPWSIGSAVSNGCIRMFEPDAEELYERVTLGTPVKIGYERVKLEVNNNRQVLMTVYPDIYEYSADLMKEIEDKLFRVGLQGWVDEAFIGKLTNEGYGKTVILARILTITVNGRKLREKAIEFDGDIYVPVWPIAVATKVDIVWDEAAKNVSVSGLPIPAIVSGLSVPAIVRGNIIYLHIDKARQLFNGDKIQINETKS